MKDVSIGRGAFRRRLLQGALVGAAWPLSAGLAPAHAALGLVPTPAGPAAAAGRGGEAVLALVHLHTAESLRVVYRQGAQYIGEGLARIDRLLRDHRTGAVHPIDPALLEQLTRLAGLLDLEPGRPFQVISGYRAPASNAMLAARSRGVATRSLHLEGRAIDIRVPGVPLAAVHEAAVRLGAGGVGYYPRSDFVHLDTGRARRWGG